MSAPCLYTVTGWGAMSCVCGMVYSTVAAQWSKFHCYKQAPSSYDLSCLKVTFYPNKQTPVAIKDDWGMLGKALGKDGPQRTTREKLLTKLQIQ